MNCCAGRIVSLVLMLLVAGPACSAQSTVEDFRNVVYIGNSDGDTITFNIPDTPTIIGRAVPVRLRGIDTPELRKSKCAAEKRRARKAQQRVHALLSRAGTINLHRPARGKYFRILADVEFDGRDLATLLLAEKLGVPYSGGRRQDWCDRKDSPSGSGKYGPRVLPPLINGVYVWPPPPGWRP